jgi:hypothetical protein
VKGCLPLQTANKITFNVHGRQPVGTRVSISCPTGYLLNGSRQLECLSNGSWSETKAQCIEICELAGLERGLQMRIVSWTDNARRADVCSTRQYIFINDSVEFACPCGFQLIGSSVRTCNGANDLSGSQPHCQALTTGSIGEFGICTAIHQKGVYNQQDYCLCIYMYVCQTS